MAEATFLQDLALVIRSKNAGPFVLTMDVFFKDSVSYQRARDSGAISTGRVAELYRIKEQDVIEVTFFEPACALKISIRRQVPSGDVGDTDVYGAQQHVPLMTMPV
jgi:hypothetical protein